MKTSKEKMLAQYDQAMEDKKTVENAGLNEIEVMPVLRTIGALRYLQDLCYEKDLAIQDITPEIILEELKISPGFSFAE